MKACINHRIAVIFIVFISLIFCFSCASSRYGPNTVGKKHTMKYKANNMPIHKNYVVKGRSH
ncbi:hypothetical protein ACFLRZ_02520 [Bacteroidota bacterium]